MVIILIYILMTKAAILCVVGCFCSEIMSNDLPNTYKDSKTLSIQRYCSIEEEIEFIKFSYISTHNLILERKDKTGRPIFHKTVGCAWQWNLATWRWYVSMSLWVIPWYCFSTKLVKLVTSESAPVLLHLNVILSRVNGFLTLLLNIASRISVFNKNIVVFWCL